MGMNYGHRMHFARLFSAIIREPRLTRPRKICYKYQRETAEIGVEKNEKKDLDDPGMHHIHEFLPTKVVVSVELSFVVSTVVFSASVVISVLSSSAPNLF